MDVLCHNPSSTAAPSSSSSSPSSPSAAAAEAVAAAAVGDAQYSSPPRATTGSEASSSRGGGSVGERSCFLGDLITGVLTCIFAVVGSIVGAITGALIGLATESGLLRGAGIGAISGAVFCIEAVESSVAMWRSNGSGIWSLLFVLDIILSLLSGRIVYEKVDPAVQNAVQSQMSAVDAPFREIEDIFETGSHKGLPRDSVDKLPKMIVTEENGADASGDGICCSVCLQDFQVGEVARRLPQCQHMFHIPCIDDWLVRHGSCPLCRRNL